MISFSDKGSFNKTLAQLKRASKKADISSMLKSAGQSGVEALSSATPYNTGLAAESWTYEISSGGGLYSVTWLNTDVENGFPVAIMLQYGYATGTGGYVAGIDYINPAIKPIFDKISDKVWKAVTSI